MSFVFKNKFISTKIIVLIISIIIFILKMKNIKTPNHIIDYPFSRISNTSQIKNTFKYQTNPKQTLLHFQNQSNRLFFPPLHQITIPKKQLTQNYDFDQQYGTKHITEQARYTIQKLNYSDINDFAFQALKLPDKHKISPVSRKFQKIRQKSSINDNKFKQLKSKYSTISISEPYQPQFLKKQYSRFQLLASGIQDQNKQETKIKQSKHFTDFEYSKKRRLRQILKLNKSHIRQSKSKQMIQINDIIQKYDSFIPSNKRKRV